MKSTLGPDEASQRVASPSRGVAWMGGWWCCWSWSRSPRGDVAGLVQPGLLRTWTTVFVAIVVQALPFLVLGVLVSGAITALVSPAVLERLLPRSPLLAVPSAALAGTALPGCECASVPVAGRLAARGVQPAAAVAFMLAAPAVNPIVLVATAVAFPGSRRWCWPGSWARC